MATSNSKQNLSETASGPPPPLPPSSSHNVTNPSSTTTGGKFPKKGYTKHIEINFVTAIKNDIMKCGVLCVVFIDRSWSKWFIWTAFVVSRKSPRNTIE